MTLEHPYGLQFEAHLRHTQQAYAERRLEDYLAGFAPHYFSVRLGSDWSEDLPALRAKIEADMQRFELLSMELNVNRIWFTAGIGYGDLHYYTRLRHRENGRVLVDRRENILVGEHHGDGMWRIICKIVVRAENHYE